MLHKVVVYAIPLALLVWGLIKAKAIKAGVDWCWNKLWNWAQITIEIREVCEDKILASLEPDFSRYKVDLYVFLRVWVVNKREVPTVPKEWTLTVVAGKQKLKAERVLDISKWHQHSKLEKQQQGFTFIEDIRENLTAFGNQPLQHGIPAEGWLCFLVRGTNDNLLQGATLRLTLIDSFGHKHHLKRKEPWNCKGNMVNPERLW
ncbi:MAG TPA: hypothetical protein VN982_01755 [Candidatus Dormibacteraeota bacterium]|nr:hypothetical protein [Candidatus Dormibacteraeota bacterium]